MCQEGGSLPLMLNEEIAVDSILGIEVGKADFHCALLQGERPRSNTFPNSQLGFEKLAAWLRNRKVERVHACLESTGGWSEELATFLHERGHAVSIVNPLTVKAFGQSELSRTKTDKADAALIARYCSAMKPRLRNPPSPSQRRLQRLGRRRVALDEMRVQEVNRLKGPGVDEVRPSIEKTIAFLEAEIARVDAEIEATINDDPTLRGKRDLLESIPGIGERVAATLLGEVPHLNEFRNSKALAAFVGLCPREFRSGTSVAASWLSKIGNSHLRRVLYMPAITAMRCNPVLVIVADRLRAKGKHRKQIIAAVMRRLLVLAYGVLKSGRPFNPALALDGRHGI
jgi:transposase